MVATRSCTTASQPDGSTIGVHRKLTERDVLCVPFVGLMSLSRGSNVAGVGQSARAAGGGAAVTEGAATAPVADAATPSSPMAETVARADRSSW
ncbi:hypothetical protein [Actinoplanes sp. NPDC026623]|uniref:hypothetical protein n=1 Tax=Actinoplanes sp. NPDC026623 TaxID=3155610 RepID=UPI0033F33B0F